MESDLIKRSQMLWKLTQLVYLLIGKYVPTIIAVVAVGKQGKYLGELPANVPGC